MPKNPYEDVLVFFGDFIAAILLEPSGCFLGRQSGWRHLVCNSWVWTVHREVRNRDGNNFCGI